MPRVPPVLAFGAVALALLIRAAAGATSTWPSPVIAEVNAYSAGSIIGESDAAYAGCSVAGVGDVNGDQFSDVAVSCPRSGPYRRGEVYVVFGSSSAPASVSLRALNGSNGFVLRNDVTDTDPLLPWSLLGSHVVGVGDVTGDGRSDLAVMREVGDGAYSGFVLLFGAASWPPVVLLSRINGTTGALSPELSLCSLCAAGDINGDAVGDMAIGVGSGSAYGSGYVLFGAALPWADALSTASLSSGTRGFAFGSSGDACTTVAPAGDLNKDGVADLVVGRSGSFSDVYVLLGSKAAWPGTVDLSARKHVLVAGKALVPSALLSKVGDIDNDGVDDLVLGAQGSKIIVVRGSASLATVVNLTQEEAAWFPIVVGLNSSCVTVAGAADFDGDTKTDVVVMNDGCCTSTLCSVCSGGSKCQAQMILGTTPRYVVTLVDTSIASGTRMSFSTVGSTNGDKKDEFAVGFESPSPGRVYIVAGRTSWSAFSLSGWKSTDGTVITGSVVDHPIGSVLSNIGDVNGDSYNDVAIASTGLKAYILFGGIWGSTGIVFDRDVLLAGLNGATGFRVDGSTLGLNSSSQMKVASAGDVNGDGVGDIVIGIADAVTGAAFIVFGRKDPWPSVLSLGSLYTSGVRVTEDPSGFSSKKPSGIGSAVSAVGDVNGDGIDDVCISDAASYVYVIFGHRGAWTASVVATALSGSAGVVFPPPNCFDKSTDSVVVGPAGDLNADKLADFVVSYGCETRIVLGHTGEWQQSSLSNSNGTAILVVTAAGSDGPRSVAGGRDVNGDGIDDLVLGVPDQQSSTSLPQAGVTYVILGRRSGWPQSIPLALGSSGAVFSSSHGFYLNGANAFDRSGMTVSLSEDFNGDGLGEVIVGAPNAANRAGAVYAVFGSSAPATVDLHTLDGSVGYSIIGSTASHMVGAAITAMGDVNTDGLADFMIGVPGWSYILSATSQASVTQQSGGALLVFGSMAPKILKNFSGSNITARMGVLFELKFERRNFALQAGGILVTRAAFSGGDSSWLSYDTAMMKIRGMPSQSSSIGSVTVTLTVVDGRTKVQTAQSFTVTVAKTLAVTVPSSSFHADFRKVKTVQLPAIRVNTTSSTLTVMLIFSESPTASIYSTATVDGISVQRAGSTLSVSGAVAGVNRVLSSLLWEMGADSDEFNLRIAAEDEFGQDDAAQITLVGTKSTPYILIGAIVGGAVGGVVVLACCALLAFFLVRRSRRNAAEHSKRLTQSDFVRRVWQCDYSAVPQSKPKKGKQQSYSFYPASDLDVQFVTDAYQRCPVDGFEIDQIDVIVNDTLEGDFERKATELQGRNGDPAFEPHWTAEGSLGLRGSIVDKVAKMAAPHRDTAYPNVSFVPLWRGVDADHVDSVLRAGYASLEFFGKGIAVSYEARRAFEETQRGGGLVLNWVSFYSAFPAIDGDKAAQSKSKYQNYDALAIPLAQSCDSSDGRRYVSCSGSLDGVVYHELDVFEASQCLPRFLVTLKSTRQDCFGERTYSLVRKSNKRKSRKESPMVQTHKKQASAPQPDTVGAICPDQPIQEVSERKMEQARSPLSSPKPQMHRVNMSMYIPSTSQVPALPPRPQSTERRQISTPIVEMAPIPDQQPTYI
eukprot:m51a1_g159 hypothetical protein (1607) ;mRNA; r:510234-515359